MSPLGSGGRSAVRYRLYGLEIESSRPLTAPVPRSAIRDDSRPRNLTLDWDEAGHGVDGHGRHGRPGSRVWESTVRLSSGEPAITLHRQGGLHSIRYTDVVDFVLQEGESRIECRVLDPEQGHLVEIYLLGLVLAYWLELQGRLALHGSGVVAGAGGVAFLGARGSGKSSLAAASMRAGSPLLSDDLLAVTLPPSESGGSARGRARSAPLVAPAYSQMRMWPDVARHFVTDPDRLPPVEPGGRKRRVSLQEHWDAPFASAPVPLEHIYLPERVEPGEAVEIRIESVPSSEALIELVRESFLVRILQAAGLQGPRLERLGRLVRSVPVRRLIYPSGLERLPAVLEAIREDGASLARTERAGAATDERSGPGGEGETTTVSGAGHS